VKPVPNCVPCLGDKEIRNLSECVRSGWISPVGPFVDRFEQLFAEYHGVKSAVSASSGTAAIHLGLIELGVRAGDLVLCPTLTFVGTANPVRYCGADVVLLDCDLRTLNLDPNCLSDFLKKKTERRRTGLVHRETGRRISALIVVHPYGNPAELNNLQLLAAEYGLPILEDAAESLGARYKGVRVGIIGEIGCFSFNGNKVITTGGGGMLISRDPSKTAHAKHLSTTARTDRFDYVHDEVGYNYRLNNLCAAVGVAQMERLEEFIALKRAHAQAYVNGFAPVGKWTVIREPEDCFGTYWMVLARPTDASIGSVFDQIRTWAAAGLGVRPIWRPLHTLPAYSGAIHFGGDAAVRAHQTTFCLPSSVGLTEEDLEITLATLHGQVTDTMPTRT
jgi:dTDP-4-amino-4,6-dideoxygalactose transaminase